MDHTRAKGRPTTNGSSSRRFRVLPLSLGIASVALLANALAYVVYRAGGEAETPVAKTAPLDLPIVSGEGEAARAHRLAGLEATERGDYDQAVAELRAALKAPNPRHDVRQLLAVVEGLRAQVHQQPAVSSPTPSPEVSQIARPAAAIGRRVPEERALILVTTVPERLIVKVDGRVRERSPARIEVSPGRHTIAIFKRNRRLFRRTVTVQAGKASHINADLRAKLRPGPSPRARGPSEARAVPKNAPLSTGVRTPDAGLKRTEERAPAAIEEPAAVQETAAVEEPVAVSEASAPSAVLDSGVRPTPDPPTEKKATSKVPAAVLSKVIDRQGRNIRACYTAQVRRQLDLEADLAQGRVVIFLVVSPEGDVVDGRIRRSTLDNPRVERCIESVIRKLEFPPLDVLSEATFVMSFGG